MNALLLGLLALGSAEVQWTDHSGLCPAAQGRPGVEAALQNLEDGTVTVVVRGTPGALEAALTIKTSAGSDTRTMRSPACDTLVEASALIAASSIANPTSVPEAPIEAPEPTEADLSLTSTGPDPSSATEDQRTPLSSTVLSPEDSTSGRAQTSTPWDLWLRASGHAGYGFTPRFGGGGIVAAGVGQRRWRVEATGIVSARTRSPESPGVSVSGWGAGGRGCGIFRPAASRLRPVACVGAEVGQLRGEGVGVNERREHVDTWAAVTAGPGFRVRALSWLQLALDLEAVVGMRRPGFAIAGLQEVHRPAAITPRVSLGLELHLPQGG